MPNDKIKQMEPILKHLDVIVVPKFYKAMSSKVEQKYRVHTFEIDLHKFSPTFIKTMGWKIE